MHCGYRHGAKREQCVKVQSWKLLASAHSVDARHSSEHVLTTPPHPNFTHRHADSFAVDAIVIVLGRAQSLVRVSVEEVGCCPSITTLVGSDIVFPLRAPRGARAVLLLVCMVRICRLVVGLRTGKGRDEG